MQETILRSRDDLVTVAAFERIEPYQQFRVYSAPVRHPGAS
jgi:hypothetical protein